MKRIFARLALVLALVSTLPIASSVARAQGVALALPVVQFVDGNGAPYAGGQLFAYAAGTLTPQNTYTDSTDVTPNANPVVLDANGRAVVYLGPLNYKFILKNALGSTVWTQDNVPALSSYTVATSSANNVATSTLTGNQAAVPLPTGTGNLTIRFNNPSLVTVQGIAAGTLGQRLSLISVGTGQVDLAYNSGSASLGNKIITIATSMTTSLGAGVGTAELIYDGSQRWMLVGHDQGAFIGVSGGLSACGTYTGSASMTWTVAQPPIQCGYYLRGRLLTVSIEVQASSVGGTPSTSLQIQLVGSSNGINAGAVGYALDNGSVVAAYAEANSNLISIRKTAGGNWTASSSLTWIFFTLSYPIS